MRAGFPTTLLWDRYGPFWRRMLADAGAEVVEADPARVRAALSDPRVAGVPGLHLRRAAAEALALEDCDLIVAPDLNPGAESARGGGQDPWIADFPSALATLAGLPRVQGVPARLDPSIEPLAIEMLGRVAHDAVRARRTWQRFRAEIKPVRVREPRWNVRPSDLTTIGLVAQPWVAGEALAARLRGDDENLVSMHRFDPVALRDEGGRLDARLIDTDAEALGAARLFARRGSVARLRMVVDRESGSDAWLLRRVREVSHKHVEVVALQDLDGPDAPDASAAGPSADGGA